MDGCGCQSGIDSAALEAKQRQTLQWVLLINIAAFLLMVVGAFFSGSSSLLSGTLDNLGDALTYGLSLAVVGASSIAKARVALFKGILISVAAIGVAVHIGWSISHPTTPIAEVMGIAATLNLAANLVCLWLLYPHRNSDINMSSVWECSRNDVVDGLAVIVTAFLVWLFGSGWPDILVAIALLTFFTRSALRVLSNAWRQMHPTFATE